MFANFANEWLNIQFPLIICIKMHIVASGHRSHSMSVLTTPPMLNLCFRNISTRNTYDKPMIISKKWVLHKKPNGFNMMLENEGMYWKLCQSEET